MEPHQKRYRRIFSLVALSIVLLSYVTDLRDILKGEAIFLLYLVVPPQFHVDMLTSNLPNLHTFNMQLC